MIKDGTIERSKSNYNSPLIVVAKPDGSIRPCIDYRILNQNLEEKVNFPLPRIDDLLNSLSHTNYISTLDCANAYHQCEVKQLIVRRLHSHSRTQSIISIESLLDSKVHQGSLLELLMKLL